ncbi:MAG: hypothetical protein ACRECC_09765 [Pseudolabrys sp.]
MSDLLNKTPAARDWASNAIQRHSGSIFGKLVPAVIWSDARGDDGEPLVWADPLDLVARINRNPLILLHNHDPGRPKGQVLEAGYFETTDNERFVAAILGFYAGGDVLSFRELGLDTTASSAPPARLPVLPDRIWIEFATDPKEVDAVWLDEATSDSPLRIERTELSHNAADSSQELIRVGLIYLAVVWSPFITSIASEAGKSTYAAIHKWIRRLFERLTLRRDPVLDIHTHQDGCQVSFLFRGKDVKRHYAAHDALSGAAAQAAQLIGKLKARGSPARQLIYEFDKENLMWFPSYAVLNDDRIITDNGALIAIEQLPTSLSLGLSRKESFSAAARAALEDDE